MWMLLVLFYGVSKGFREIVKKKSLYKNSVIEVLFYYTLISFIMILPDVTNAGGITLVQMGAIALKSFVIFAAWIFSFRAIEHLPISLYVVLDLSRVLFATLLGIVVLGEVMTRMQTVGLVFVLIGLILLKFRKPAANTTDKKETIYIIMALLSCILNAVSGLMDKLLMKEVTSSQLQFWYMLFLVFYYGIYILVTRTRICWRSLVRNYWIYVLSILFVLADRALFMANGMNESKITIMTLIKQSGCVVTIVAGKFIFHEKNTAYKMLCAAVIVVGIVIAVM